MKNGSNYYLEREEIEDSFCETKNYFYCDDFLFYQEIPKKNRTKKPEKLTWRYIDYSNVLEKF